MLASYMKQNIFFVVNRKCPGLRFTKEIQTKSLIFLCHKLVFNEKLKQNYLIIYRYPDVHIIWKLWDKPRIRPLKKFKKVIYGNCVLFYDTWVPSKQNCTQTAINIGMCSCSIWNTRSFWKVLNDFNNNNTWEIIINN